MKRLLVRSDFEKETYLPNWLLKAYRQWSSIVSDNQFPCHFGVKAEREGHLRYTFCENHDFSTIPYALTDFLRLSKENPSTRHALVLFVQPEQQTFDFHYYNTYMWNILSYLHGHDDIDWPEDIPLDPHDSKWEFVFNGEPIFISGNAPFYKNRTTRNLGDCLILIFQPRRIFADLSVATPHGKKAVEVIRKKVENIENIPYHPDLGSYEDTTKREWKQYLITDDMNSVTGECPFRKIALSKHIKKEKPC